jgi:integrase
VLSLAEIETLWKVLDQHHNQDHADAIKLILLTAQRPGEVVDMHRNCIEGCWWKLTGSSTKSGRPNRIYLASLAREIINRRPDDGYLFPTTGKSGRLRRDTLKATLVKLMHKLKEKGVEYFTLHDLRRSAATGIAALGYGAIVPDILNHKVTGITRLVYDQYSRDPEKQMAFEAWDKQLQKIISSEGNNVNVIVLP